MPWAEPGDLIQLVDGETEDGEKWLSSYKDQYALVVGSSKYAFWVRALTPHLTFVEVSCRDGRMIQRRSRGGG
jgi:hypothetical protein